MRDGERHDGSDIEEQVPMEEGGEHENMMKLFQKGKFIRDMTLNESRERCDSFTPTWDISGGPKNAL